MVNVENALVSRMKKGENKFEILVDPKKAEEFRQGKEISMDDVLAYPGIYKDVRKGDLFPDEDLQKNFGTTYVFIIAKKIVLEGELQFTTEQRRKLVEQKTNEIANIISRRAINPQTNTPHPPQRILNSMEQVGVHIDPFLDTNTQVDRIVKSIKVIIPIRIESVVVQIIIPPQHAGKVYSELKRSFEGLSESWLNDGSLQMVLTIPAGIEGELLQKIGNLTKGNFKSKIIKRTGLYGES